MQSADAGLSMLALCLLAFFGAEIRGELVLDVDHALVQKAEEIERILRIVSARSGLRSRSRRSLLARLARLLSHHLLRLLRFLRQSWNLLWSRCARHLLLVHLWWTCKEI